MSIGITPGLVQSVLLAVFVVFPCSGFGATITVTTSADVLVGGDGCSLREAIINANNNDQSGSAECAAGSGADEIVFDPSTDGSPVFLSAGTLEILGSLTLTGNGFEGLDPDAFDPASIRTLIDATNLNNRALRAQFPGTVVIEGLGVTGGTGVDSGSALLSSFADVTLRNTVFFDNIAGAQGAIAQGGAVHFLASPMFDRALRVENSMFLNNSAVSVSQQAQGGALAFGLTANETAVVVDSVFIGNTGAGDHSAFGGALFVGGAGAIEISRSLFRENRVSDSLDNNDTTIDRAYGGAVVLSTTRATIDASSFIDNTAQTANHVAIGGAIAFSDAQDATRVENSTFSGNAALSPDFAQGGALGLVNFAGTTDYVDLQHVTITENLVNGAPSRGGGVFVFGGPGLRFRSANSIIAGNFDADGDAVDCFPEHESIGHTIIGDDRGCTLTSGSGDQIGNVSSGGPPIDPLLAEVADNGSPVLVGGFPIVMPTRLPLLTSPALDQANPSVGTEPGECLPLDQVGTVRPINGDGDATDRCDIGALEAPTPTFVLDVAIDDPDFGEVISDPAGIDCPAAACQFDFELGTSVELSATATGGGTFFGWGGACAGNGTCVVAIDADRRVTAIFGNADAMFINGFE